MYKDLIANPNTLLDSTNVEDFSGKLKEMRDNKIITNINLITHLSKHINVVRTEYIVGRKTYNKTITDKNQIQEVLTIIGYYDEEPIKDKELI